MLDRNLRPGVDTDALAVLARAWRPIWPDTTRVHTCRRSEALWETRAGTSTSLTLPVGLAAGSAWAKIPNRGPRVNRCAGRVCRRWPSTTFYAVLPADPARAPTDRPDPQAQEPARSYRVARPDGPGVRRPGGGPRGWGEPVGGGVAGPVCTPPVSRIGTSWSPAMKSCNCRRKPSSSTASPTRSPRPPGKAGPPWGPDCGRWTVWFGAAPLSKPICTPSTSAFPAHRTSASATSSAGDELVELDDHRGPVSQMAYRSAPSWCCNRAICGWTPRLGTRRSGC